MATEDNDLDPKFEKIDDEFLSAATDVGKVILECSVMFHESQLAIIPGGAIGFTRAGYESLLAGKTALEQEKFGDVICLAVATVLKGDVTFHLLRQYMALAVPSAVKKFSEPESEH